MDPATPQDLALNNKPVFKSFDEIPQRHLLPHPDSSMKVRGALYNQLDESKIKYILEMRKALCNQEICFPDGSLNLKYFNVKKGHYWSKERTAELVKGVIKHGACNFKAIKKEFLPDWTETEIRLRTCKLLRFYNLEQYKDKKFTSEAQILDEAKNNRKYAMQLGTKKTAGEGRLVGGILFNPKSLKELDAELSK